MNKVNYFNREGVTRHEKLQRAKELYIDFLSQDTHEKFSTFSPSANAFVLELFKKYKPNELAAFFKYVGIRIKAKKSTVNKTKNISPKLIEYSRLGIIFEEKVKELLLLLNQHKMMNFQLKIPVKGHEINTSYLKPDIVINDDIWIDCKLSLKSNLKETALKYDGHARVLEFYVLMSEGIEYGIDPNSGQVVRSIWNVLNRGKNRIELDIYNRLVQEFKDLEREYIRISEM